MPINVLIYKRKGNRLMRLMTPNVSHGFATCLMHEFAKSRESYVVLSSPGQLVYWVGD